MNRRYRRRRRRGANLARVSVRLYRALLWLYPPSLRRAYGDDMLQLFHDTLRQEITCAGPPGALRAWTRTLADLAASLPREWPRELGELRRRRYRLRRHVRLDHAHMAPTGSIVYGPFREPRQAMNTGNFERFTERARKTLSLAQEEAQRFGHDYIGTEHLLLGLVREGDGVAAKVLADLGVELDKVRSAVEFIIGHNDRIVLGEIGLTPRAKKVIELAIDEARRLNHHYVGTEHLLLGLVREGEGIAAGVLESLGVNLEKVRRATIATLDQGGPGASQQSASFQARPRPDLGRFTGRARQIIAAAITEARERDQREVGTGHTLLALLSEPDGVAAWALRESGIDLDATRQALEGELGPRPLSGDQPAKGPVDLDTHTLRMIALAADEASQMGHRFVGPEHLLLGLTREGEGLGGRVLLEQAADIDALRTLSLQRLSMVGSELRRGPGLGQITLLCRDVAATSRYYIQFFGANSTQFAEVSNEQRWELRLPGGGPLLTLRAAPADATPRPGAESIELEIWVGDVDLMWRTLKDAGAANLLPISADPRGRFFTVSDPDGRTLRISARRDQLE